MTKYYTSMVDMTKMLSAYSGKYYLFATGWYEEFENATEKGKLEYIKFVDDDLLGAFPDLAVLAEDEGLLFKAIFDGVIVVEFDDKESLMKAYFNIVGDDGNSGQFSACTNPYSGDMRVYAVTIYDGISHHENT